MSENYYELRQINLESFAQLSSRDLGLSRGPGAWLLLGCRFKCRKFAENESLPQRKKRIEALIRNKLDCRCHKGAKRNCIKFYIPAKCSAIVERKFLSLLERRRKTFPFIQFPRNAKFFLLFSRLFSFKFRKKSRGRGGNNKRNFYCDNEDSGSAPSGGSILAPVKSFSPFGWKWIVEICIENAPTKAGKSVLEWRTNEKLCNNFLNGKISFALRLALSIVSFLMTPKGENAGSSLKS